MKIKDMLLGDILELPDQTRARKLHVVDGKDVTELQADHDSKPLRAFGRGEHILVRTDDDDERTYIFAQVL